MQLSKPDIRRWWSSHPQDYLGWNAPEEEGEESLEAYVNRADAALHRDHWDLHQGDRVFGELLPYDQLRGRAVLEVGCGLGAVSAALAREGARVSALDLSDFGVRATRWRMEREKLSGAPVQGDAENLPFPDSTFDYVWSWGVIHHSPNTARAVEEIRRVLAPGGSALVMVYHRHGTDALLNILLRYGVLRLQLLRYSADELLTRYSDGKLFGGCPLAQYFSRERARELFRGFSRVEVFTHGYREGLLRAVPDRFGLRSLADRLVPRAATEKLLRRNGHFLIIRATK